MSLVKLKRHRYRIVKFSLIQDRLFLFPQNEAAKQYCKVKNLFAQFVAFSASDPVPVIVLDMKGKILNAE